MRTKRVFHILECLSAGIVLLALPACGRGPDPGDTIRNLYGWYLRELKKGSNPLEQGRAELKEFVTENFLASLDNMRPDLENSPYFDAQSFDGKLAIQQIKISGRAATLRVVLSGRLIGRRTLDLYLVKADGRWKIDDMKFVEEMSLSETTVRTG